MPKYAKTTTISSGRTRDEIECLLARCGATTIFTNDHNEQHLLFVAWSLHKRPFKFELPLPDPKSKMFTHDLRGKRRKEEVVHKHYQQATRQYWRIARNYIYMLLEIMEATGMEFHEAFAPLLALKGGGNLWQLGAREADSIQSATTMKALLPR